MYDELSLLSLVLLVYSLLQHRKRGCLYLRHLHVAILVSRSMCFLLLLYCLLADDLADSEREKARGARIECIGVATMLVLFYTFFQIPVSFVMICEIYLQAKRSGVCAVTCGVVCEARCLQSMHLLESMNNMRQLYLMITFLFFYRACAWMHQWQPLIKPIYEG